MADDRQPGEINTAIERTDDVPLKQSEVMAGKLVEEIDEDIPQPLTDECLLWDRYEKQDDTKMNHSEMTFEDLEDKKENETPRMNKRLPEHGKEAMAQEEMTGGLIDKGPKCETACKNLQNSKNEVIGSGSEADIVQLETLVSNVQEMTSMVINCKETVENQRKTLELLMTSDTFYQTQRQAEEIPQLKEKLAGHETQIIALQKTIGEKKEQEGTDRQESQEQLADQEKNDDKLESTHVDHKDKTVEAIQLKELLAEHEKMIRNQEQALRNHKEQHGHEMGQLKGELAELKRRNHEHEITTECEKDRLIKRQEDEIQQLQEKIAEREKTINEHEQTIREYNNQADIMPLKVAGIEDVCSKNRPTQVADAYSNLMNNQWLDAFIELPDGPEDVKLKRLVEIMQISWTEANKFLDQTAKKIESFIEDPFSAGDPSGSRMTKNALPPQIQRQAIDIMKEMCEKHDTRVVSEHSKAEAIKRGLVDGEAPKAIYDYIDECCRVAWRMVLQQPQMKLAAPEDRLGQVVDPLKEDIYADSKPKGVISNYVKAGVVQEDKYFVKALVNLQ